MKSESTKYEITPMRLFIVLVIAGVFTAIGIMAGFFLLGPIMVGLSSVVLFRKRTQ